MKVNTDINAFTICCRSEPADDINTRCTWACIYLDLNRGIMSACTDCGNYAYRWPETGKEFIQLIANADKEYLLSKVAKSDVFDVQATIESIREYFEGDKTAQFALDQIEENSHMITNAEGLLLAIEENYAFDCLNGFPYDDTIFHYRYSNYAVTFVELFVKYVQPQIKELIKQHE